MWNSQEYQTWEHLTSDLATEKGVTTSYGKKHTLNIFSTDFDKLWPIEDEIGGNSPNGNQFTCMEYTDQIKNGRYMQRSTKNLFFLFKMSQK